MKSNKSQGSQISTNSGLRKKNSFIKRLKSNKYLLLIFLPGIMFFIVFEYMPMFGVVVAFQNYSVWRGVFGSQWVGLRHFEAFFNSPHFFRLLRNTALINVYSLIFMFPIPIIFAVCLNEVRAMKFKKLVQTVSFIPRLISTTIVVSMMVTFMHPSTGIVNAMLNLLGQPSIYFFGQARYFRFLYVASDIWQDTGYAAIIYLAALSGVDSQLYEACFIDGGGRWKQFKHITLPGISTTIILLLIINIGKLLRVGAEKIILMYNPLTYETADVFKSYVYRIGLVGANFSIGAAVDFFNNIVGLLLLIGANYLSRKVSKSSLW